MIVFSVMERRNVRYVAEAEKCREESPNWENKIAPKCIIGGKADEKGVEESSQCPADIGTAIRCPAGDECVGRGRRRTRQQID